jgi:hemerythrin-like domain-containing protein
MADAIDTMMSEHRLIEKVLDALDGYAGSIRNGDDVSSEDMSGFVTFFREFADAKHHAKEEEILFTAMINAGFPREAGPIAVMLHEHTVGRDLVGVMAAATSDWNNDSRQRAAGAATEFGGMLRAHIQKEDNILYPMARQRVAPEIMAGVHERCATIEDDLQSAGTTERLESLAQRLIERYG